MVAAIVGNISVAAGAATLAWLSRRKLLAGKRGETVLAPLAVAVNLLPGRNPQTGDVVVLCTAEGVPVVVQHTESGWRLRTLPLAAVGTSLHLCTLIAAAALLTPALDVCRPATSTRRYR